MRLSTEIYFAQKESVAKKLGLTIARINELCKMDHDDATDEIMPTLFWDQIAKNKKNKKGQVLVNQAEMFDEFDEVYYYKQSLHFVSPRYEAEDISTVNTTVLEKMDKDIIIDTVDEMGDDLVIKVAKRIYPIQLKNEQLWYSIAIYKSAEVSVSLHLSAKEALNKVYVEHHNNFCMKCNKICNACSVDELVIRSKRNLDECGISLFMGNLWNTIYTAMQVMETYFSREVVVKKRKVSDAVKKSHDIMIARDDNGDTERVLPIFDYVYEYHESQRKEWQGGHHKSPVAHERRGYFRKARRGNYIMVNGEFVQVQNGTGNFIFVGPSKVNWDNDAVQKILV